MASFSTLARRFVRLCVLLLGSALLSGLVVGCASYTTPGRAADMSMFGAISPDERDSATDNPIRRALERQPLASFPVNLAVARVQSAHYRSRSAYGHGGGGSRYSVVTTRDIETDEDIQALAALPMVRAVAPMNRLLLPEELKTDTDLRQAAAQLKAEMLLIYTFDTNIYIGDSDSPLDVVTLGFIPSRRPRVTTTASAIVVDTRNGYVYGTAEGTAEHSQFANAWTTEDAVDQARRRTEREALDEMLVSLDQTWRTIVATYAAPAQASER